MLVFLCLDHHAATRSSPRLRLPINDTWQFFPGEHPAPDGWLSVTLPHTWNVDDTLDDTPGYRRAAAWYRRELRLDEGLRGKRVFVYFEGVNQVAEVFVNDKPAGKHIGGYTGFSFDVTELLHPGATDVLTVKVDNSLDRNIPPVDGDFNMYGGIYRDVWMIVTEPVHFKTTEAGSGGIVIATPSVADASATVEVSGTIANRSDTSRKLEVITRIGQPNGKIAATLVSRIRVAADSEIPFRHGSRTIRKPSLWSPEDPKLYKVSTVIRENGRVLDEVSDPLGFRWFDVDAKTGFLLNGRKLKLRGTNRHQDHAGLGNAVPDRMHVRDLEIIKENGFNFLRLAHYPQDPAVLDAADRLGLILWQEIPIVNQMPVSAEFNENARNMLREMIRQHRNHPSIAIWGYMNEVFLPRPKTDDVVEATVRLARELEAICRSEDPGRLTAIAFDWGARDLYNSSGLGDVARIVGWNLYHGWYYQAFADFGKFLDDQHRRFPDRPLIVSEYGANGDPRVHSLAPRRFDSSVEWQRMFHEAYLPQIEARPFIAGSAIWNQFDFASEFRGETIPHINQKGMYTFDRKPKDVSFFYRASYSRSPVVHIAVRDWPRRGGPRSQPVTVYSNLDNVELFNNGRSLGSVSIGEEKKASWDVEFDDERNILKAVARGGGRSVVDEAEVRFESLGSAVAIAVNCGSNTEVIDDLGVIWRADVPVAGDRAWSRGENVSVPIETRVNILGTLDDAIYQRMREGPAAYRFDVRDGRYEIELRFVESRFKSAGERVFGIRINRRAIVDRLDLIAEAGYMNKLSRTFAISATGGSGLELELVPIANLPIISGIRLTRIEQE
jgi:beta-galactosidase